MPIATLKPAARPPIKPNVPKVEPAAYKSVVVEDSVTPFESLMGYVSGSAWTVQYYSQLIAEHNDLRDHDPGQLGVYQQYTKIVNLEIRVTSPIDSSQDNDSALVKVTGSGTVFGYLIPNVGDLFVASVGDGENGLFRVIQVDRKNFNRNTVFGIDYELINYLSRDSERFSDLESKVNDTVYFDKSRAIDNASPVLQEEEYVQSRTLKEAYFDIVKYYFSTFFSSAVGTLIVPGQTAVVYDGFLVNFIMKIVQGEDAPQIRHIAQLSMGQDVYLQQKTFWDCLLHRDADLLPLVCKTVGLVNCKTFSKNPTLKGLRFTRMEYVVYPTEIDRTLTPNVEPHSTYDEFKTLTDPGSGLGGLLDYVLNQDIQQNIAVPYINKVIEQPTYVFSEAFYSDTPGQTVLEVQTMDYLKGKMLDVKKLTALAKQCRRWGRLEQFYYIPILLTLIKVATISLY